MGAQMLAIAMWSEYGYDLDLARVIMMLVIHELEEMVIGDVIPFEVSAEEKKLRGREAVVELLSELDGDAPVRKLAEEFYAQGNSGGEVCEKNAISWKRICSVGCMTRRAALA